MTISKSELRRLVREREAALTRAERLRADRVLTERLLDCPQFLAASSVLLYFGVGAEPDTLPLLTAALERGKRVALPKITGPGTMEAREIRALSELVPGAFGIPEPADSCPVVPPEEFDLILVPGAAFSPDGRRLGRGGGYYDRYLPRTRGVRVAAVRHIQLFDALPVEAHDVPVDLVITDESEGTLCP